MSLASIASVSPGCREERTPFVMRSFTQASKSWFGPKSPQGFAAAPLAPPPPSGASPAPETSLAPAAPASASPLEGDGGSGFHPLSPSSGSVRDERANVTLFTSVTSPRGRPAPSPIGRSGQGVRGYAEGRNRGDAGPRIPPVSRANEGGARGPRQALDFRG